MNTDPRLLLGGHAAGVLDTEERRALYAAALAEQELYDELMEDEPLRELMADPEGRQALLTALAEARRPLPFYRRPSVLAGTVALAATLAGVAVWVRTPAGPVPAPAPGPGGTDKGILPPPPPDRPSAEPPEARAEGWAWAFEEPLGGPFGARLTVRGVDAEGNVTRDGEVEVVFSLEETGAAVVLEERADGRVVRLFPRGGEAGLMGAGERRTLPAPGERPLAASGAAGPRRVRLLALPEDVDVQAPAAVRRALRDEHASVSEREYSVEEE